MTTYVLRRLGFSVFVLWGALTIVFAAIRLAPGDPAQLMLGTDASPAEVAALREAHKSRTTPWTAEELIRATTTEK